MVLSMITVLTQMHDVVEESKAMAAGMTGISRDLNVAVGFLSKSSSEYGVELVAFVERLKRIDELCEQKSNLLK